MNHQSNTQKLNNILEMLGYPGSNPINLTEVYLIESLTAINSCKGSEMTDPNIGIQINPENNLYIILQGKDLARMKAQAKPSHQFLNIVIYES
jgi:hypothetical protein